MAAHFEKLASKSGDSFKNWAWGLLVAVVVGGAALCAFVYFTRPPSDATNAQVLTHALLDVLIVGFVVFAVRFVAIQTRAHRHVQFVSTNKANALSTFNLIVTGQEDPAVRTEIASALAQAVFKSDDGIFSDSSGDSVTVIERVVGAVRPTAG